MPFLYIYFVTNGLLPDEGAKERAKTLENTGHCEIRYYSTEELFELIDTRKRKDCEVNIITKGPVIRQDLGNVKGIIATIEAKELIQIYEKAGKEQVFEKNIRYFLGNNKINKKIKETIESEQDSPYFWFLNNGISIVCSYFSYTSDYHGNEIVKLKNPTIVNGGQTTRTLYEVSQQPSAGKSLGKVYLLSRIYETEDEELIRKITEGTNTQNPISLRDLKANDKMQVLVKSYFLNQEVYLETKRNEYREAKIPYKKIVKNDSVFQAYLSLYKNIPYLAKSSKSGVFEKYFSEIFVKETSNLPPDFFRSFKLWHFIKNKEEDAKIDNGNSFLLHASFAILFTMGEINPAVKDSNNSISSQDMEDTYKKAINLIKKAIKEQQELLKDAYSHNRFFKSSIMVDVINKFSKIKRRPKNK